MRVPRATQSLCPASGVWAAGQGLALGAFSSPSAMGSERRDQGYAEMDAWLLPTEQPSLVRGSQSQQDTTLHFRVFCWLQLRAFLLVAGLCPPFHLPILQAPQCERFALSHKRTSREVL